LYKKKYQCIVCGPNYLESYVSIAEEILFNGPNNYLKIIIFLLTDVLTYFLSKNIFLRISQQKSLRHCKSKYFRVKKYKMIFLSVQI